MDVPFDDPLGVRIMTAVQASDLVALEALRDQGIDLVELRIVDVHGTRKTLIHVAADWPGHFVDVGRTITWLADAGVPLDAGADKPGGDAPETALHWAASSDDLVALDALLDAGADIEAPGAVFTGGTALSDAVIFQKWRAAARLVERGARTTPWQAAALGLLDQLGSDLTVLERDRALWHACAAGREDSVELLLRSGADPTWRGPREWTSIEAAKEYGHPELLPLLVATD